MAYWLVKTEPDAFSWTDQVARGSAGEPWTGVRNHQAKAHLLAMRVGDAALFYHTGGEKQAVGIVRVVREAYPDPTDPDGGFVCVDVAAEQALRRPVPLAAVKADPRLAQMALVRLSRLSVQPVTPAEWAVMLALGGLGQA
jgi:predicted RNA-binding protein with PUA-like domain